MRAQVFLAFLALALLVAPELARAADLKSLDIGAKSEVWYAEDHTIPVVAFVFSLPAGSAYDPAQKPGLADFAAALLDEGAGNLNSEAFHEALANLAIRFDAIAERDDLVVSITTLSGNAPAALHLLSLALSRPRFEGEAVSRVRARLIQDLKQSAQDPTSVADKAFMGVFFNGHPYGHPVEGDAGSLEGITAEDLRDFTKSHWVRGDLKVAVAGDITAGALTALLKSALAPLPAAAPSAPPPVGRLGAPGMHVTAMPVPQPTAYFGLPGIMRADPDFIPGYVANYILGGGGLSSRLMDEVRVKRGLTYSISTSLVPMRRASVMVGEVATRADTMRQTIAVVKETLAKFAANGPTDEELADAETFLTGSFPLAFASNAGAAAQLGEFQRQGIGIDYIAKRNDLIGAVTIDDVRRAAKRLFNPARLTVVIAGLLPAGRVRDLRNPLTLC